MELKNWQIQLRKGVLELIVLGLLRHGKHHGYEIVQILKKSEGFSIHEGNIYPILTRLQVEGLIKSKKEPSTDGPPRKYYLLTDKGTDTLNQMISHWDGVVLAVDKIVRSGVL